MAQQETQTVVIAALEETFKSWSDKGLNNFIVQGVVPVLTGEKSLRSYESPFTKVREIIWSYYSGGGASANAAQRIFTALGREDEIDYSCI